LNSPLRDMIDVRRPGESCIKGHPQITSYFVPFESFREKCYWSALDKAQSGTREDDRGTLRDINDDYSFTLPPLKVFEV